MKALVWSAEAAKGEMYDTVDIPATHVEAADEWRGKLLEAVAENDEEMMELYLEGQEPSEEQLYAAIRRITIASDRRRGHRHRHPGVLRYRLQEQGRSAPARRGRALPPVPAGRRGHRGPLRQGPGRGHQAQAVRRASRSPALAFKIASDPHLGKLTFIRVYSGRLEAGTQVQNSVKGKKERIGKIYRMHANKREEIESVGAGDIVAVMGLKQTTTGETLSRRRAAR